MPGILKLALTALTALTAVAALGIDGAAACSPERSVVPPPSPLLDAVGLAPPRLSEAACAAAPIPAPPGWTHAAVYTAERLVWGPARMCDAAPLVGDRRGGFTFGSVTVDPRGRVIHATRFWTAATAREAAAAVDSALAGAAARPATGPLACRFGARARSGPRRAWWSERGIVVRAFPGPGYQAMVTAQQQPGGFYALHAEATARGFVGCMPERRWPVPAGTRAPAA